MPVGNALFFSLHCCAIGLHIHCNSSNLTAEYSCWLQKLIKSVESTAPIDTCCSRRLTITEFGFSTVRSAYCYRLSSVVCRSVSRSVTLVSSAKTAEAIEMPFASTNLLGPGKHRLHITDRFGRILYCVHSTQYSLLVFYFITQTCWMSVYTFLLFGLNRPTWAIDFNLAVCIWNRTTQNRPTMSVPGFELRGWGVKPAPAAVCNPTVPSHTFLCNLFMSFQFSVFILAI